MLVVRLQGWQYLSVHFGPDWNKATKGWLATKFCKHIHGPRGVDATDVADHLTFPLAWPLLPDTSQCYSAVYAHASVAAPYTTPISLWRPIADYWFIQALMFRYVYSAESLSLLSFFESRAFAARSNRITMRCTWSVPWCQCLWLKWCKILYTFLKDATFPLHIRINRRHFECKWTELGTTRWRLGIFLYNTYFTQIV